MIRIVLAFSAIWIGWVGIGWVGNGPGVGIGSGVGKSFLLGWVIVLGNASVGSWLFWLSVWWVMGLATGLAVHLVLGLGLAILFAAFVLVLVKNNALVFSIFLLL